MVEWAEEREMQIYIDFGGTWPLKAIVSKFWLLQYRNAWIHNVQSEREPHIMIEFIDILINNVFDEGNWS